MKKSSILLLVTLIFIIYFISIVSAAENMALIPAGTFIMGTNDHSQCGGAVGCSPAHSVTLDSFYIDKYEVTVALWNQVKSWGEQHGYDFSYSVTCNAGVCEGKVSNFVNPLGAGNQPARRIPWHIMLVWSNARSEMEGLTPTYYTSSSKNVILKKITSQDMPIYNSQVNWNANGYRLPTEAEWEYAARGGLAGQKYPWGNNLDNSKVIIGAVRDVGSSPANGYGLFNMADGVSEWVWDTNTGGTNCKNQYSSSAQTNPRGPNGGHCTRIWKGGRSVTENPPAWFYVARRGLQIWPEWFANGKADNIGFRTVKKYFVSSEVPSVPASVPSSDPVVRICTENDWTSQITPVICPSSGQITRTWTKIHPDCQNGSNHPSSEIIACTYNAPDSDMDGIVDDADACPNTPGGVNINRAGCPLPFMTKFNLRYLSLSSRNLNLPVSNFEFGNNEGTIKFNERVKLMSENNPIYIDDYASISQNKITLNPQMLPELNKSATITFNNINFTSPVILRDGVRCEDCIISSYNEGILIVEVNHFTSYEVVDESYFNPPPEPIPQFSPLPTPCYPDWNCSEWTNCSYNQQTRTCTDMGACNDYSSKPIEYQLCTINFTQPQPKACKPNCNNIECGEDDGCGNLCWTCLEGETCDTFNHKCVKPFNFIWVWVGLGVVLIGIGFLYYFKLRIKKKPNISVLRNN